MTDVDFIVANNGNAINETCTASSMVASSISKQGKQTSPELEEKQDSECQEFTAEQKRSCSGSGCSFGKDDSEEKNIAAQNSSQAVEPINFTEEIQRLLNGEELKFIDETDDL